MNRPVNDRSLSFQSLDAFETYLYDLQNEEDCLCAISELDITLSRLQGQLDEANYLIRLGGDEVDPKWLKSISYCYKMHKSYRERLQNHRGALRRDREQAMYLERKAHDSRIEKALLKELKNHVSKEIWDLATDAASQTSA